MDIRPFGLLIGRLCSDCATNLDMTDDPHEIIGKWCILRSPRFARVDPPYKQLPSYVEQYYS